MAILAAILVPSVNGYIVRSRKTEVIKQCREMYKAIETYNITASKKIDCDGEYNETTVLQFYPSSKNQDKEYVGPIFSNEDSIMGGDCNNMRERMGAITEVKLSQLKEIATAEDGDILDRIEMEKFENQKETQGQRSPYIFKSLKPR